MMGLCFIIDPSLNQVAVNLFMSADNLMSIFDWLKTNQSYFKFNKMNKQYIINIDVSRNVNWEILNADGKELTIKCLEKFERGVVIIILWTSFSICKDQGKYGVGGNPDEVKIVKTSISMMDNSWYVVKKAVVKKADMTIHLHLTRNDEEESQKKEKIISVLKDYGFKKFAEVKDISE